MNFCVHRSDDTCCQNYFLFNARLTTLVLYISDVSKMTSEFVKSFTWRTFETNKKKLKQRSRYPEIVTIIMQMTNKLISLISLLFALLAGENMNSRTLICCSNSPRFTKIKWDIFMAHEYFSLNWLKFAQANNNDFRIYWNLFSQRNRQIHLLFSGILQRNIYEYWCLYRADSEWCCNLHSTRCLYRNFVLNIKY